MHGLKLQKLGMRIERQKAVPLFYENVKLDCGFRADLIVEGRVALSSNAKTPCILSMRLNYCHICGC